LPICKECGRDLAETEFHRQGQGKRRSICKYCTNARNVKYRERDKAKGKTKVKAEYELKQGGSIKQLPPWPDKIKIGNPVTIQWEGDGRGDKMKQTQLFLGEVTWMDDRMAVIKGKHYSKTLDRIDLHTKKARVL